MGQQLMKCLYANKNENENENEKKIPDMNRKYIQRIMTDYKKEIQDFIRLKKSFENCEKSNKKSNENEDIYKKIKKIAYAQDNTYGKTKEETQGLFKQLNQDASMTKNDGLEDDLFEYLLYTSVRGTDGWNNDTITKRLVAVHDGWALAKLYTVMKNKKKFTYQAVMNDLEIINMFENESRQKQFVEFDTLSYGEKIKDTTFIIVYEILNKKRLEDVNFIVNNYIEAQEKSNRLCKTTD